MRNVFCPSKQIKADGDGFAQFQQNFKVFFTILKLVESILVVLFTCDVKYLYLFVSDLWIQIMYYLFQ